MTKHPRRLWHFLKAALVCWSLQSLASHTAELPPGCERSEVRGVVYFDSAHFREEWRSNQWQVIHPAPERDVAQVHSALFPVEDLEQLTADPAAAGVRVMKKVDEHLCRPRPESYTLEWASYLQSEHGGSGRAWLTLWARQFVNGVPADNQSCNIHFARDGALLGLHCRLLAEDDIALSDRDWPDQAEVVRVAEAAYLSDLRNLPGAGQKVASFERVYRSGIPTVIASHVGCGKTFVNARTLEARYGCDSYDWPERPQYGLGENEDLVQLDDLPPYFEDGVFAADAEGGYLLSGRVQRAWADPSGRAYEEGEYLLAFNSKGQLRWRYRLADSGRVDHIGVADDDIILWQQVDSSGPVSRAVSLKLSLAEGSASEPPRAVEVSAYRDILIDETGQKLYTVHESEQQWQVRARNRDGVLLWRADLPGGIEDDGLAVASGGGLGVLSRDKRNDPMRYEFHLFDDGGELLQRTEIISPERIDAELVGVAEDYIFLLVYSQGKDGRGLRELRAYSIENGKLQKRLLVPLYHSLQWAPDGTLLHFGGEGGWALLGGIGENVAWRRHFGFGVRSQFISHASAVGEGQLAVLAKLDYERSNAVSPDRRAILRLDLATVGEQGRSASCPFVSHDKLRNLELALWSNFHLYVNPPQPDYLPNLDCIDARRMNYRNFMQTLHDELDRRRFRAPGFFSSLTVEPGQPGLRFRGGGAGQGGVWSGGNGYQLRVQFSDAALLAAYLQDTLEPHARLVHRLLEDFRVHTGASLGVTNPQGSGPADMDQLVSDLRRVLQVARALPYSDFPEFGGHWTPPTLLLGDGKLSLQRNRPDPGPHAPMALSSLDPQSLRNLLQTAAQDRPDGLGALAFDNDDSMARDNFGNTNLHLAVLEGDRTALARLSADERLVNTVAYDGATPLHRAVFAPHFPAPLLAHLVRAQRDINARNIEGETALHLAVHTPELVELLLAAGADPNLRDKQGATPLHRAAAVWLGADSVSALLAAGADASLRDANGDTARLVAEHHRLPANAALLGVGEKDR